MKKKLHVQEEINKNDHYKTTDNKEDIELQNYQNQNLQEQSSSADPIDQSSGEPDGIDRGAAKVVSEVRAAEEKLAEISDKYIRLSAEFDNYRKRTLREKMDMSKYAGENLLVKILPLMDDFERALRHVDSSTDCEAMKDGIELIYTKFSEFLKQNGVKEIESVNSMFNVDLHEAVAKVPVPEEDKKGMVVDVVLKGYYLQDKVLRFSKVVVGE